MTLAEIEDNEPAARTRIWRLLSSGVSALVRFVGIGLFAVLALATGVGSAHYMIARGSALSVDSHGPWRIWRSAATEDADPYTRAHFAAAGELRLPADSAGVYEATTDDTGARLHSSCDYLIEGSDPDGLWWSLSVFDANGRLIANDAYRYAFTRTTAATSPDGSYIVSLGRDARPGNWLPTGGAGRLTLVLTLLDPATGLSDEERDDRAKLLPAIRREGCS